MRYLVIFFTLFVSQLSAQSIIDSLLNEQSNAKLPGEKYSYIINYCEQNLNREPHNTFNILRELQILVKGKNFNRINELYNQLGNYYQISGQPDSAIYYYKLTVNDNNSVSDTKIKSYIGLCTVAIDNKDIEKAKYYIRIAEKINTNTNNLKGYILLKRAIIAVFDENYPLASSFFQKSVDIFRKVNDTIGAGQTYYELAVMYYNLNNYLLSIDYLEKSEKLFELTNTTLNLAKTEKLKGIAYCRSTKYKNAQKALDYSLALFKDVGFTNNVGEAFYYSAKVYIRSHDLEKARNMLDSAFDIALANNNIRLQVFVNDAYGDMYDAYGNYNLAIKHYLRSVELLNIYEDKKLKTDLYLKLSDKYAKVGNFRQAHKYQLSYVTLENSLLQTKHDKQLSQIKETTKNEILSLENEKRVLRQELYILNKRNKGNRHLLYLLISTIIFLTISFVLFLYKNKKSKQRLLQFYKDTLKEQESRIENYKKELDNIKKTSSSFMNIVTQNMWEPYLVIEKLSKKIRNEKTEQENISPELLRDKDQLVMALNLLNNVIFWAKNQQGLIDLYPEDIKVDKLILPVIELLEIRGRAKDVSIKYDSTPGLSVYGDMATIEFSVRNIIENAIKFSTYGNRIDILVRENSGKTEIFIKDRGVGMTKDQITALFDSDNAYYTHGTFGEKGCGLGLSLSKEFIERNFGKLIIESSIAVGTNVTVLLSSSKENTIK